ncbi:MAG: nucleoside deaminase [Bacteroidetes bacterium]|nr:MAG: nucleoside deaminase [Bacteroidota bacterium]TAG89314.1 MAG: nucleoside deaminase [Bacteroidota bacterium]
MENEEKHIFFMKQALVEAQKAFDKGEVPVGAIITADDKILIRTHNLTEQLFDISAHAEMMAITGLAQNLKAKYLPQCTLYVTLEPCVMCAGAIFWSQINTVIFGAKDEKRGFLRLKENVLHQKTKIISGILEEECQKIMTDFFKQLR